MHVMLPEAGNTAEALSEWQAAAEANDPRAMAALGRLYLQGLGVLQDYVEAHRWFNLAASRGEPSPPDERLEPPERSRTHSAQHRNARPPVRKYRTGEERDKASQSTSTNPAVG